MGQALMRAQAVRWRGGPAAQALVRLVPRSGAASRPDRLVKLVLCSFELSSSQLFRAPHLTPHVASTLDPVAALSEPASADMSGLIAAQLDRRGSKVRVEWVILHPTGLPRVYLSNRVEVKAICFPRSRCLVHKVGQPHRIPAPEARARQRSPMQSMHAARRPPARRSCAGV